MMSVDGVIGRRASCVALAAVVSAMFTAGSALAAPLAGAAAAPLAGSAAPGSAAVGGASAAEALYLNQLLMLELYSAQQATCEPPAQNAAEQLRRALSNYFTDGAAATSVPNSGPIGSYFTNGAQELAPPTSVIP